MRTLTTLFALLLASLISSAAQADSWRHGRGVDRYHGIYSTSRWSSHYPSYRHHSRSAWNHHTRSYGHYYSSGYPYRGNSVSWSFGHYPSWRRHGHSHHHYSSSDAGSFIGGLVIGGLLSDSLSRASYRAPYRATYDRYENAPVVRTRVVSSPTVIHSSTVVTGSRTATPRTRLLRDLQGRCFEITHGTDGTEQRAQLPDEFCTF